MLGWPSTHKKEIESNPSFHLIEVCHFVNKFHVPFLHVWDADASCSLDIDGPERNGAAS